MIRTHSELLRIIQANITRVNSCQFWLGELNQDGYPIIPGINYDRLDIPKLVYKIHYEIIFGNVSRGTLLKSTCGYKTCVCAYHRMPYGVDGKPLDRPSPKKTPILHGRYNKNNKIFDR